MTKTSTSATIHLDIEGMHCAACSARIERVVGKMPGVISARVNLASGTGTFVLETGMVDTQDIQTAIKGLGFTARMAADPQADFERRQKEAQTRLSAMQAELLPAFGFSLPLVLVAMGPMMGLPLPEFLSPEASPRAFALTQLLLCLPVVWIGRGFYLRGFPALARRSPDMDSLVALGTGAAFAYSVWNTAAIVLTGSAHLAHDLYFESAAVLLTLISLGKYFEARSRLQTTSAIQGLLALTPKTATVLDGQNRITVPVESIRPDDMVLVLPGERIPVDGLVREGSSRIDESMLTGEPMPTSRAPGQSVSAGTVNMTGPLVVQAREVGPDTLLAGIIRLVQEAQGSKAPIADLADRISFYFVPVVMVVALVSGLAWWIVGGENFPFALRIAVAVLVIACPCAMGLATPMSIMVGTGVGAGLGVLIKGGGPLQSLESIRAVVFDKTGTLTKGRPETVAVVPLSDRTEQDILAMAASIESRSEHPLARAVLQAAEKAGIGFPAPENVEIFPGMGISGLADGRRILVGNQALMDRNEGQWQEEHKAQVQVHSRDGHTVILVAENNEPAGLVVVADPVKAGAREAVEGLKRRGLAVAMLTGDQESTARSVAASLGIKDVSAGVLPDRKVGAIRDLQDRLGPVAMVGDGINDAPALARAQVGLAMASGTDIAMDAGDVVLMNDNPLSVVTAIDLGRAVMTNIRQNLFWAFAFNILGIPVAAGVLHIFDGPTLNPMLAGTAMALSSTIVVTNALRLRRFRPSQRMDPIPGAP
ncbi:MAG: copper-translocating P-type ATPase [Deltaproteobacteria bacterium]|nr:copper-translocating P-type ATPase [Deltaproteobacteria bacterium]